MQSPTVVSPLQFGQRNSMGWICIWASRAWLLRHSLQPSFVTAVPFTSDSIEDDITGSFPYYVRHACLSFTPFSPPIKSTLFCYPALVKFSFSLSTFSLKPILFLLFFVGSRFLWNISIHKICLKCTVGHSFYSNVLYNV